MKTKPMEQLEEYLKPIINGLGVELVEVQFKQGKNPSLTVYIDKDGGVDMDTCESVHNAIDAPLDEFDPTYGEGYTLNVSSVGLDWPYKKAEDFEKHMGNKVEVWLKSSVSGKKQYDGELCYYDGEIIRIKLSDGKTMTFDLKKQVEKVNNYIDF